MNKKLKWSIIAIAAVVVVAAAVIVGGKLANILYNPDYQGGLFDRATATPDPITVVVDEPTPEASGAVSGTGEAMPTEAPSATPSPSPTIDPYDELMSQADATLLEQHIVNFLLIGVDYEEARVENWNGKDGNSFHSDVMMVLAVNFDEGRVDLISLPRDTYANIPGVKGIYKLNASLNCGTDGTNYGLFCKNGEGFEKVCEAAEWMLGGIEVNYYYAVTMEAVKQLVDAFGGVWYDVEGDFDNGGRYYKAGYQFMDGQAVLDYMRVRKAGHTTMPLSDSARVNRQKNMMVAIYNSMKANNLMVKIPEVLSAFDGALFTNCTIEQTAALAAFGTKMNSDNIGLYSMSGSTATLFHWNFCFTDQSNRKEIIKTVYNVDVSGYAKYTKSYAQYRWADMLYEVYADNCKPLTEYVQKLIEADDLLPEFTATPEPSATPSATPTPTSIITIPTFTPAPTSTPTETPWIIGDAGGAVRLSSSNGTETRKYSEEDRQQYADYLAALEELDELKKTADTQASRHASGKSSSLSSAAAKYLEKLNEVQTKAIALAKTFGYSKKGFDIACSYSSTYVSGSLWGLNYWNDKSFNAVKVNFN